MAKIRFGYSDDFTAKNNKIGINTTIAQENVDVVGVVKGKDLRVTGVSSQTGYEGFLRADHQIEEETQLNFGQGINASLSGEIIVGTGQTVTVNEIVKETAGVGDNGGTLWHNLVAGKHSGIIDGAFWNGEYFDLDGSNDVITGESCLTLFTDDTDHTIEMWVKFDDVTTRRTIISGYKSGDADRWDLEVNSGKLKGGHHDQGYFTSTASVVTGRWYHLVYVHDHASSLWRVFIDTSTDVTYANAGRDLTSNIALGIGDRKDSSIGHLDGQISIVRIYNRELTSTEISTNYNLGPFSKETSVTDGLITHYNASNPSSYPGTLGTVDTTNTNIAGGGQIECMKVYNTFTPPSGDTNQRPSKPKPGELYYNYDFKTIEFHDGYGWRQVDNTTRSGRALFAGGRGDPGSGSSVDFTRVYSMQVNTLGSSVGFGDLTLNGRYGGSGVSNSTRGIVGGGWQSPVNNFDIEYFTLASGGNGIDWGQNNAGGWGSQGASSSTRGLNAGGGYPSATATIESIFFSTVGTKEDFGDITAIRYRGDRACNSTVRGVFSGGYNPSLVNTMDAKDLHSTADTVEFGELNRVQIGLGAVSNSTRGVWMGGWAGSIPAGSGSDVAIDMITIATFGNAVEFGELSDKRHGVGTCQNMTRGVVTGGNTPGSSLHGEYITIQSAGNALDFGDLNTQSTTILSQPVAMPDSHGGLGGF